MKRVLLALLLVAGIVAAFLLAGRESGTRNAIERALERGPGHVLVLADRTDFEWERVFLFSPYTTRSQIDAALGSPWRGGFDSDIESSDSVVLVVFERRGQVVEHFDLSRGIADFAPCTEVGRTGIARDAARFVVGSDGAVTLVP